MDSASPYWQRVGLVFEIVCDDVASQMNIDSVPVLVYDLSDKKNEIQITSEAVGSTAVYKYLIKALKFSRISYPARTLLGGLVFPAISGSIVTSDIVPSRLVDCEILDSVV